MKEGTALEPRKLWSALMAAGAGAEVRLGGSGLAAVGNARRGVLPAMAVPLSKEAIALATRRDAGAGAGPVAATDRLDFELSYLSKMLLLAGALSPLDALARSRRLSHTRCVRSAALASSSLYARRIAPHTTLIHRTALPYEPHASARSPCLTRSVGETHRSVRGGADADGAGQACVQARARRRGVGQAAQGVRDADGPSHGAGTDSRAGGARWVYVGAAAGHHADARARRRAGRRG